MPSTSPGVPAQLFFSYSHKDKVLRDQLETHLSTLKRENRISAWHDRRITAGTEWKGQIDERLKSSSIILLLVTANFLASDYCNDVELRYAMEQHQQGKASVIPVILRPCDWKTTIFAKLQALPTDGKPVIDWKTRDAAFLNVVEGIRKALDGMGHGAPSPASEKTPGASSIPVPVLHALHQLPTPPADFTGRSDELKELLTAVRTGGVTISGLQGLGGVGKTALALKLAEQLKPDYADAQFYLDLKGVTQPLTPRDAMAYIVRAWHPKAQLPENLEEVAAHYRSVLEGKRALLLMDNARDAQQVAPLIPPAGCLLLVTSRKHFALPGLFEKNLDKLPPADARDLLLRIAPRLKKEKTDQINELVRLCGYLPLALRAVASALQEKKNISPADYAKRLADTRQRLKLTETDAALQSSYELLSDDLRQKLCFLAVFLDTFDLAAAAAVWNVSPETSQDAMGELLAYSLVEFDEITGRYNLHDLVRLFVGQFLKADERYTAQKRHAGHYLEVMRAADALYKKGGESVTRGLALFDLEATNIRTGHDWVVDHHQDHNSIAEWCWQYPIVGVYCLLLRQHPRERIRWLETALTAARRLKNRQWEGAALGNLAFAYDDLGEYRRAIEHLEQVLQITRECGNRLQEGTALGNLGNAYHSLGEFPRAIEFLEQHLKIAREIGDRRGEANALGNLGSPYLSVGEYKRAIEYYEQGLQVLREIGDRRGEGYALGNLGTAYYRLGEYRRAIEYHEQSLTIKREIGDRLGEANSLFNSALVLDQLGDGPAAIARAEDALEIHEAIESPYASKVRKKLAEWREDKGSGQGSAE
ncbi:MAG TPA: tetratricopeptide repeat protein [Candidatus Angelobacter sp.]